MLNTRSFSEIFEEVQGAESTAGKDFSSGWESHLDPHGMAQIIAELSIKTYVSGRARSAYPFKKKDLNTTKPMSRPRPEAPAHVMTSEQNVAFIQLASLATQLQNNFNRVELKSAYRQAVLKTHPDQGGNSESFQGVKKSYHILLALAKN
jgi:hypothetical protein